MLRISSVILIILCTRNIISGQQAPDDFFTGKTVSLRTNPFSFIGNDAGLMLGTNFRWHPRWSATIDPQFIFFTTKSTLNGESPGKPLGIRVKTDFRYHIRQFILGFENVFIAPEFTFGHVRTKKVATFGINCTGPNCDYYMKEVYTQTKTEKGFAVKCGLTGPVKKRNPDWKLELFLGIGFSYFDFREKGLPDGASFLQTPVYEDNLGIVTEGRANIMIPAGIKIIRRIR